MIMRCTVIVFDNLVDPISFDEAAQHDKWRMAMDTEMQSIEKSKTWELEDLATGAKKIGVKWIYKIKYNE